MSHSEHPVASQADKLEITPLQLLHHAQFVRQKYRDNPHFGVRYLEELLVNSGHENTINTDIAEVKIIIDELRQLADAAGDEKKDAAGREPEESSDDVMKKITAEIDFRKQIEEYYLPKQLVDAIMELGEIPKTSIETLIGIGFIDIADYTYLSKFLSPQENQVVLNGLYTAFNWVLRRHGGYLNKIEGDSMMFHFGGLIDRRVKEMAEEDAVKYIAKELFYTCVEMQRVCVLFNQANDKFVEQNADPLTKESLTKAFDIISTLRNTLELSSAINALFQIRIRIGANIGTVMIGNFGPHDRKQWDIVGLPVINAKRMESTAPIGGLRISEELYTYLKENGIVDFYFQRFKREAEALGGTFKTITMEDLFSRSTVVIKEKRDAVYETYSVQVNPGLPESIAAQVALLLEKERDGANMILELLQYYRGNRYVIDAIEKRVTNMGLDLRKDMMLKMIYPKKYHAFYEKLERDADKLGRYITENYSLFELFEKLGDYQDKVKWLEELPNADNPFTDYNTWFENEKKLVQAQYRVKKRTADQKCYFYNMVFPLVFTSILGSILQYQNTIEEELEEL